MHAEQLDACRIRLAGRGRAGYGGRLFIDYKCAVTAALGVLFGRRLMLWALSQRGRKIAIVTSIACGQRCHVRQYPAFP